MLNVPGHLRLLWTVFAVCYWEGRQRSIWIVPKQSRIIASVLWWNIKHFSTGEKKHLMRICRSQADVFWRVVCWMVVGNVLVFGSKIISFLFCASMKVAILKWKSCRHWVMIKIYLKVRLMYLVFGFFFEWNCPLCNQFSLSSFRNCERVKDFNEGDGKFQNKNGSGNMKL